MMVTLTKKKHCFDCVILSVRYYSKNRDGKDYWLSDFFLFYFYYSICLVQAEMRVLMQRFPVVSKVESNIL